MRQQQILAVHTHTLHLFPGGYNERRQVFVLQDGKGDVPSRPRMVMVAF